MSEGDSPHGALSDSETNNSIIHKVRTRVSSIIPNSFSKWFSPSSKGEGKNGSNRRRREISEEQDSSNEESYNQEEENGSEPPVKRTKCDLNEQSSTSLLEDPYLPSTSRIHNRNNSTRSTFVTSTTTKTLSNTRKLASTPTSFLLNRNHRHLGLTKTVSSTPYDFNTKSLTNELSNFDVHQHNNSYSNNNLDTSHYSRGLDVRKRMKIDSIEGRNSNNNTNNYERTVLNSSVVSGLHRKNNKSFTINNNNLDEETAGSDILVDEDEVDELTLPIEDEDGDRKFNGMHGTPSESDGSICSFIERPGSSADINLNDDGKGIHQNRMSLKNAKTGIHFSSHLQSEKSLFSDKNLLSGLTNSSMSLNSWNRRPSFNASLYGSTSALSDSRLLNVKSPFYDGQTIYGGASTYAKNINRMQKALRVPVQIRPVSSLSTSSSSNTSNNNPVLSNTAKRILDLMNQFNVSSPLNDAKKMGNTLSSRVPPLSLARHNHIVEDELNLNRSIRLNSAKSPYSRPDNKVTRPVNKSLTTELQIPSVSQLLQIKRLQNKTEELRQLANESKSILNTNKTTTEYKLPGSDNTDGDYLLGVHELSNNSNKHINKIKNKISATRPDKKQTNVNEQLTPMNLPNISFPAMKSVPQFDICLPASASDSSRPTENNLSANITSKVSSITTETPKSGNDSPSKLLRSENFKFEFSAPKKSLNAVSLSNNVHKKSMEANAEFSFSKPIPVSEIHKASGDCTASHINFEFRQPITITKTSNGNIKEVNKKSSPSGGKQISNLAPIPAFNFNKSLDSNKSNSCLPLFTGPKTCDPPSKFVASNKISNTPPELKSGSVMDVLMKFKNEKVKIDDKKNDNSITDTKEINPLADMFKPKTGTWECEVCMIRNDSSLTKCLACETPNPTNKNSCNNSVPLNTLKPVDVPVKDDLFKKLVEKQNEKWECSTCDTRNDSSRNKCICCEQAKPGAETSEPTFSFGSSEPKFSFGIPAGTPASSASAVLAANTTSFRFGSTTTTTASTAVPPTFTFGNAATSTPTPTVKPVAPAVIGSSGFTFGIQKPVDHVDASKTVATDDKSEDIKLKPAIASMFGTPASNNSNPLVSSTISTSKSTPVSIESKLTTSDASQKAETTTSFVFGIQNVTKTTESPLVKPTINENSMTPSNASSSSSAGGFKFTPPNNSSSSSGTIISTNIENKPLASTPAPVTTTSTVIGQQITPAFGQTSGFSLFKKPENASPLANTPLVSKTDTKPIVPTFGSTSLGNKIESTSAIQNPSEVKPVNTFVFGSSTNSTASKTENIFGSSTINPAPPVTTSAPTFGSPASYGFPAATTANSSITSPFTGFGSSTSTPTIGFGTKLNQTPTPTFGSFGGNSSTNQPASTTNNTNTHTVTPVFGSFGATESTSTLDPPNNTAPFGQPAKIFGVNSGTTTDTPVTVGFGNTSGNIFGQITTSATFGSQLTQSNFGTQPATALSTFGTTATSFNPPPQQNDAGSAPKNVFQFGGVQQTNEQPPLSNNLFQFGASNNSNNNAQQATFNFSTTTPTSFNFTATAPTTNSTQPFTFGGAEPPTLQATSGGFNFGASSTEVASNSPFQFGATPGPSTSNLFAATPAGPQRRKVKPARRLR